MKYILLCIVLSAVGVICGLIFGIRWSINWCANQLENYMKFMTNDLTEIVQWDLDKPDTLVPYLGAYEEYTHANIIIYLIPDETKSACFDFSKWETHNIIGETITAPNIEEENFGIIPDVTLYKFEEGLCYWL